MITYVTHKKNSLSVNFVLQMIQMENTQYPLFYYHSVYIYSFLEYQFQNLSPSTFNFSLGKAPLHRRLIELDLCNSSAEAHSYLHIPDKIS